MRLNDRGATIREIAKIIGRSPSTVSREMSRNTVTTFQPVTYHNNPLKTYAYNLSEPTYSAQKAQEKTNRRKQRQRKKILLHNKTLYKTVTELIRKGWSPEIISGYLWVNYGIKISYETIYNFIYAEENKELRLWEYLVRAHPKRKKKHKHQGNRSKSKIKRRISISKRPKQVNNRKQFGHWEADSVLSGKTAKGGLHTLRERKTRYKIVRKISDLTAQVTIDTLLDIFRDMPKEARRTVTFDNGVENHLHYLLQDELNIDTYFCHPYSSWEKGSNENANGLYRRFYPKGTDFSKESQEDIDDMVYYYNNRPMKCLGFITPQEAFERELAKL
jgi:IS30 family transposase